MISTLSNELRTIFLFNYFYFRKRTQITSLFEFCIVYLILINGLTVNIVLTISLTEYITFISHELIDNIVSTLIMTHSFKII